MATGSYGLSRFKSALEISRLPPQDQQNPVHNNNPNSSANNTYPYNAAKQRAEEPVITSSDGTQSSKPESPEQNYGSGVLKLQARLANLSLQRDAQQPQTLPNPDTSKNLSIAKEQNNMEDANYKEIITYVKDRESKDLDKKMMLSGFQNLGDAIGGGNTRFQEYWSGGLVK